MSRRDATYEPLFGSSWEPPVKSAPRRPGGGLPPQARTSDFRATRKKTSSSHREVPRAAHTRSATQNPRAKRPTRPIHASRRTDDGTPLATVTDVSVKRTERARRASAANRSPHSKSAPVAPKEKIPFRRYVHAPPPEPTRVFTEEDARRRMVSVLGILAVVLLLVLGRVALLQTADGSSLRDAANQPWTVTRKVAAPRGAIFDRNGEELAVSVPAYVVSVNPKIIKDPEAVVATLTTALTLDESEVAKLRTVLADKSRGFAYVRHQVDVNVGRALRSMKIEGVNVDPEAKRVLPGGDTGRSIIGRTDVFGSGINGLEMQYNDILTGSDGKVTRDVAQKGPSIAGSENVIKAPIAGQDLVLTIDRSIQFTAEQVLAARVEEVGAKSGTVIVMDTHTGDAYAMASVKRDDADKVIVSPTNSAAVDAYEPGSVVKVITAAGALDAGAITPTTTFDVPYRRSFKGHWLEDAEQHPNWTMNVHDILVKSSNMGTIAIMEALTRQTHWEYMRKFGLGEKTALAFPNESTGILHPWDDLFGTEPYTVAYGQGVASTSIQLISAVNAIANDGVYVAPRLVSGVVDSKGTLVPKPPATSYKVVSEAAATEVQGILREVVCKGTGIEAQTGINNFAVAGKTGTGYKAQPDGTYKDATGNYVYYASFVGFFPAEDPRITVLVSIDEPRAVTEERFGGKAAAPVFARLAPTIMSELGITPPDTYTPCAPG